VCEIAPSHESFYEIDSGDDAFGTFPDCVMQSLFSSEGWKPLALVCQKFFRRGSVVERWYLPSMSVDRGRLEIVVRTTLIMGFIVMRGVVRNDD
jgi:hypothetical protein